jgi:undecaprenyl phosphate-alpha-L-ara4FN deformylase
VAGSPDPQARPFCLSHTSDLKTSEPRRPRIALKVDCDTAVGTREGVPRLLEIFAKRGIRATFFFTFGPDRSGVAARRVFTQPGFLSKMLRSRAASLYGFPTVLYGTLLPAPVIGQRCESQIREPGRAGHETGVHGWDHVGWHDRLDRWDEARVRAEYGKAHDAYRRIFGTPAKASAAPGWTANALSLAAEADRHLVYTSNTRGGEPFFPSASGRDFSTLEVPTTLPTLDETLAWPELRTDDDQLRLFRSAAKGTHVFTLHTEVEGRSKAALFERLLDAWMADGVALVPLEELARERLREPSTIPRRPLSRTALRGRGGTVATGWPD